MRETSRDVYGMLMRRIAQVTQAAVARDLGISTSQMSRIVAGETGISLDKLPDLLESLSLLLIETNARTQMVTITQSEYEALITMADIGIGALKGRNGQSQ